MQIHFAGTNPAPFIIVLFVVSYSCSIAATIITVRAIAIAVSLGTCSSIQVQVS